MQEYFPNRLTGLIPFTGYLKVVFVDHLEVEKVEDKWKVKQMTIWKDDVKYLAIGNEDTDGEEHADIFPVTSLLDGNTWYPQFGADSSNCLGYEESEKEESYWKEEVEDSLNMRPYKDKQHAIWSSVNAVYKDNVKYIKNYNNGKGDGQWITEEDYKKKWND